MNPVHIFINGCSFLTDRKKEGVYTHTGLELAKFMDLPIAQSLAAGGRGNKRISFTTKVWCEKNPELAKKCFFLIGITAGTRFDYPTNDGYKKHKFPSLDTTWKTFSLHQNPYAEAFFKVLFGFGMDVDQHIQIESIDTIVDLQNFFQVKKYPYVMYKTISDTPIKAKDVKVLFNAIDKTRFFKPETSHYNYVIENKLVANMDDPHPNTQGHIEWASQLKEFIDANNLRTI
jgi:hypothetical protein|tara:strand:+ start:176 stop:868 length:693 start_codon:yes stop_codon:yes gene_type:complete